MAIVSKKQKDRIIYLFKICGIKIALKGFQLKIMIPSPVPKELPGLTQTEEMLIARAFPVVSVHTKPGGQRAYKSHCINFPQDIQKLADTLPRYPNSEGEG